MICSNQFYPSTSCYFENMYLYNGKFYVLNLTEEIPDNISICSIYRTRFKAQKINKLPSATIDEYRPYITVYYRALFVLNWVHCLFDSVYPAFLALSRFNLEKVI